MFKRLTIITMAVMLITASSAMAETAVDTIMNVGTTQAFTDEAVSVDDLKTIMRAGLSAASAINQQPWYFVAITNQELMNEIAGSGMSFAPPVGASGKPEGAPEDGEKGSFPAAPAASGSAPPSFFTQTRPVQGSDAPPLPEAAVHFALSPAFSSSAYSPPACRASNRNARIVMPLRPPRVSY